MHDADQQLLDHISGGIIHHVGQHGDHPPHQTRITLAAWTISYENLAAIEPIHTIVLLINTYYSIYLLYKIYMLLLIKLMYSMKFQLTKHLPWSRPQTCGRQQIQFAEMLSLPACIFIGDERKRCDVCMMLLPALTYIKKAIQQTGVLPHDKFLHLKKKLSNFMTFECIVPFCLCTILHMCY